jgi:hypothetical protein
VARETKFDGAACGYCGAPTRQMFLIGKGSGKSTRQQHTRWKVCRNGHKIYRKRS